MNNQPVAFVKERSLSQTILEVGNESKSRVDRIGPNRPRVDRKDKTSVDNNGVDPSHQSRHDLTQPNGLKVLDRRQKTSKAKVPAPQNRLSLSPRKAAIQNGETTPVRLASSELGNPELF